jgi:hypothetical protein
MDVEDITVRVRYEIRPGTNIELGLDELYDETPQSRIASTYSSIVDSLNAHLHLITDNWTTPKIDDLNEVIRTTGFDIYMERYNNFLSAIGRTQKKLNNHARPFKMALNHAEDLSLIVKIVGFEYKPKGQPKNESESEEEHIKLSLQHNVTKFTSARIVVMGESPSESTTFIRRAGAVNIDPSYVEIYSIEEKLNTKELQKVDSIRMIRP